MKLFKMDYDEFLNTPKEDISLKIMQEFNRQKEKIDAINPSHYRQEKVQCIDAMRYLFGDKAVINFCLCNVFKYLWRYEDKNGDEDVEKSKWYIGEIKRIINANADDILNTIPQNMREVLK